MDAKKVIKNYLDKRAETDSLFAVAYANKEKNIDECWKFILGEARKKAGRNDAVCMSDAEVFGLAVHYYDEADIKVDDVSAYDVVAAVSAQEKPVQKVKPSKRKKRDDNQGMQSLFNFG